MDKETSVPQPALAVLATPRIRMLVRPGQRLGVDTLAFVRGLDDAAELDLLILSDGTHEWAAMILTAEPDCLLAEDVYGHRWVFRRDGRLLLH